MYEDKVFLVTGGTGSIGSAVVDRLVKANAKKVVVFSRDENKQYLMKLKYKDCDKIEFIIGDVRDYGAIDYAIMHTKSNYVFHAAAMKHVPFCEDFVMEGIKTNIIGSNNVFDSAIRNNVEKVVFLSTDKAVEPSCIMGMSKAIAEKIAFEKVVNDCKTKFCVTRFGNIIGSRGSVIPLFFNQAKNGEVLTVTDPNMTRFFMSVEDAVNLVFFAFDNGESGDLFVYKAKSFSVGDLASAVIDMCSSKSIVKVVGNRGGEKLHEVLISENEMSHSEDNGDYYRINPGLVYCGKCFDYVSSEYGIVKDIEDIKKFIKNEKK